MKKMGKWLLHGSAVALLMSGASAYASDVPPPWDGLGGGEGFLCKFLHWDCDPPPPGGKHDHDYDPPHGVPEPEMLGLFGVSVMSAAIAAYRRRRRK